MFALQSFDFKIIGKEEKDSSTDESQENSFSTNDEIIKIVKSNKIKPNIHIKKKSHEICYTLNLLENVGNFIVNEKENGKLFIIKIRKIHFPDCNELFEKGRVTMNNCFKEEMASAPDITFWNQRYYYYSLFDKGIKMDYESKLISF